MDVRFELLIVLDYVIGIVMVKLLCDCYWTVGEFYCVVDVVIEGVFELLLVWILVDEEYRWLCVVDECVVGGVNFFDMLVWCVV